MEKLIVLLLLRGESSISNNRTINQQEKPQLFGKTGAYKPKQNKQTNQIHFLGIILAKCYILLMYLILHIIFKIVFKY